jgi:hypothetical protein
MARTKQGMSYTWRSILQGVELLNKGVIWRVGDEENLNIWTDPWLPRDGIRKPITPKSASLLQNVSDLVNPSSGTWDDTLVKETFWEEDVKLILTILVHEGRDNMIYVPQGIFSVKSAYKVYGEDMRRCTRGGGPSSAQVVQDLDTIWRKIWKLKCPKKMINFLWRFAHNSHAVRANIEI